MQCILPGVAKGRVPQVVCEGYGLYKVFIQTQWPRNGAGQLRHFQRMREPRAKQVALMVKEHLGLVNQSPECRRVDNTVAVALKLRTRRRYRFKNTPPT